MKVPLDIVGSAKFGRYPKISVENTYNMIISDDVLVPYPGYKEVATVGDGTARGVFRSIGYDHLLVVVNDSIYAVSPSLYVSTIALGLLDTSIGSIYFAENGINQIAIVDGTKSIYVFNWVTGAATKTTIPSTGPLADTLRFTYIDFQDSYFIASDGNSHEWRLSANNVATSWPVAPQNIGELQREGDRPQAAGVFGRKVFVLGSAITDIFEDVGNTLFPYLRENALGLNYGVISRDSIASNFDVLVWLGTNKSASPSLIVSRGGEPRPLTTDGIEFFLGTITKPESGSGFLFEESGHLYYQLTFPDDNVSLVYDFSTDKFYQLTNELLDYHIAKQAVYFNNKNYFISFVDNKLYEFGSQFSTYNGRPVPRFRITKPYRLPVAKRFSIKNIELTLEQGISEELQKVGLSMSKDGGELFGNIHFKELNNLGRRKNRLRFWKMGSANDVTFKFQFWTGNEEYANLVSDDQEANATQRFVIIDGVLEIEQ